MAENKTWTDYFTRKIIVSLSVIATVLTLVGGIWGFEEHYATNKRVDDVVVNFQQENGDLEIKLADVLESQQKKADLRYFRFLENEMDDEIYKLKRKIEQNPTDELLKKDYEHILNRREVIRQNIEKILENKKTL